MQLFRSAPEALIDLRCWIADYPKHWKRGLFVCFAVAGAGAVSFALLLPLYLAEPWLNGTPDYLFWWGAISVFVVPASLSRMLGDLNDIPPIDEL